MASADELTTGEWIRALLEPGQLLAAAMSNYVRVSFEAVFQRGQVLAPLFKTDKLRDESFARFWVKFTSNREQALKNSEPPTPNNNEPQSAPPRALMSSDLIPPILAKAFGIVLDVGPGTGTQMPLLLSPAIKAIYGAEPCVGLHKELRARAQAEGLSDKYHILPCSVVAADLVPELQKQDLMPVASQGIFDTIVCVRVLCSVPDMEKTVGELYGLLRPGGQLLITEHVVNPWRTAKGSVGARVMQGLYEMLGWRFFMGDCCMDRDTEAVLRKVAEKDGGWESVELDRYFGRTCMPYIAGTLVKKST
ncbi:hypothetical protein ASPWEDRAFT_35088 [Aspergillus wentii DTO 134E9]|uniref:Methyltransferase type 11 domain-containing protein n=1 Tax=Aspergillus wentii DTO 134E9 TaxID=1073089 RepID=A0A1L9S300_ASPWE|nr:uncharacterized protein ASPWEDRAFT_35088 [Aspergillus wentii DTO 134E9]KAI9929872.1 hypothetical protein MW887_011680 [Aspergillus wentii]OJJ41523.1 hypothetical protein ASPWEDRAFT_35088 [Aspergillus wentii DTO 134E9]